MEEAPVLSLAVGTWDLLGICPVGHGLFGSIILFGSGALRLGVRLGGIGRGGVSASLLCGSNGACRGGNRDGERQFFARAIDDDGSVDSRQRSRGRVGVICGFDRCTCAIGMRASLRVAIAASIVGISLESASIFT